MKYDIEVMVKFLLECLAYSGHFIGDRPGFFSTQLSFYVIHCLSVRATLSMALLLYHRPWVDTVTGITLESTREERHFINPTLLTADGMPLKNVNLLRDQKHPNEGAGFSCYI